MLGNIIRGFVNLYKTDEALKKHLILFMLVGISFSSNLYFNYFAETKPDLLVSVFLFIFYTFISLYLFGFLLKYLHKITNNKQDVVPDFTDGLFTVALGAIPLVVTWVFYTFTFQVIFSIFMGVIAFFMFLVRDGVFYPPIIIMSGIFLTLILAFVPFVYIAYSKKYSTNGLFNILLPIEYIRYGFKSYIILVISMILIFCIPILFLVTPFLILCLLGINHLIMSIFFGFVFGYLFTIYSLVFQYCLVRIYENEIEPYISV